MGTLGLTARAAGLVSRAQPVSARLLLRRDGRVLLRDVVVMRDVVVTSILLALLALLIVVAHGIIVVELVELVERVVVVRIVFICAAGRSRPRGATSSSEGRRWHGCEVRPRQAAAAGGRCNDEWRSAWALRRTLVLRIVLVS